VNTWIGVDMSSQQKRYLDLAEQVVVVVLYSALILRLWPSGFTMDQLVPLLILPTEGLVVVLLLIRRRTDQISINPWDWCIAAVGTTLVLLIDKGGAPVAGVLGPFLMVFGLVIHVGAKLSLWKSFGLVAANRGVRSNGLYSVVRHPMYAGYIISQVGFLLAAPSIWNAAVYAGAWAALVARIYAEERLLDEDAAYGRYRTAVPYRLMPGVF